MSKAKSRILIVDDHSMLAHGLGIALRHEGYAVRVTGELAYERILGDTADFRPDVVLLDLYLDGENPSIDLIGPLTGMTGRVLVLTAEKDPGLLGECLEAGAWGVSSKEQRLEEIIELIELCCAGRATMPVGQRQHYLNASVARRRLHQEKEKVFRSLTPREEQVLSGLMRGLTAAEIATESYVSLSTVRSQIQAVLQKLAVGSQLQAVVMASEAGWQPRPAEDPSAAPSAGPAGHLRQQAS